MTEGPETPSTGDDDPAGGAPPPGSLPDQPPPPPAPQAPQSGAGTGQPAGLMTRFLAKLVDWVLVGVVISGILLPWVIGSTLGSGGGIGSGALSTGSIVTSLVTSGLALAYFAVLESHRGQTLGKMLLGLRVKGPDGRPPTLEQALKRNAYMLLSIVPFLGGLAYLGATISIAVTINSDESSHQGWHDEFADGTRVVRTG